MAITLLLIVGTLLIGVFFYNEFYYKKPVIPNSIQATVKKCELSQSRVAKKIREEEKDKPYNQFELYDITYEFVDLNGDTVQTVETVRYREDVGTIKTMVIERKRNGHKELKEVDLSKPKGNYFFLVGGLVAYLLIVFFSLQMLHQIS